MQFMAKNHSGGCLEVGRLSVSQRWGVAHLYQNALGSF